MIFEDFEELALNPPYIEQECVYRVDVHCHPESDYKQVDETEFEVMLTQSFIYPDWAKAESKLSQIVTDTELKKNSMPCISISFQAVKIFHTTCINGFGSLIETES